MDAAHAVVAAAHSSVVSPSDTALGTAVDPSSPQQQDSYWADKAWEDIQTRAAYTSVMAAGYSKRRAKYEQLIEALCLDKVSVSCSSNHCHACSESVSSFLSPTLPHIHSLFHCVSVSLFILLTVGRALLCCSLSVSLTLCLAHCRASCIGQTVRTGT